MLYSTFYSKYAPHFLLERNHYSDRNMQQYEKKIILHIQNSVFKYICGCTQSCHYSISTWSIPGVSAVGTLTPFLMCSKNKKSANRSHEGSLLLPDSHVLLTAQTAFIGKEPQEDRRVQPPCAVCDAFAMNTGSEEAEGLYRSSDHLSLANPRVQFRAAGSLLRLCRRMSSGTGSKRKNVIFLL